MTAAFSEASTLKVSSSLKTVRFVISIGRITLPSDYAKFVNPEVLNTLNTGTDLTDLFDEYGTHFIKASLFGGYCECNIALKSSSVTSKNKVTASLKAAFEEAKAAAEAAQAVEGEGGEGAAPVAPKAPKAASGSLSIERTKALEETFKTETEQNNWRSAGGNVAVFSHTQLLGWAASVHKFPTICGFPQKQDLASISSLCATPERRKWVEAQARAYLKSRNEALKFATDSRFKVVKCEELEEVFNNDTMGTANDLTVYLPVRNSQQQDFFFLGHVAENHHGSARTSTYIVKDPTPDGQYLKPPLDCVQVWNSSGSMFRDFSFWKMIPPEGYVALGFILSKSHAKPDLSQFRCVNETLTEPARLGPSLWSNSISTAEAVMPRAGGFLGIFSAPVIAGLRVIRGGGALRVGDKEVELYPIEPVAPLRGLQLSLFRAFDYWNNPKGDVYTLKNSVLER